MEYGEVLPFSDITEESLSSKILELLSNTKYRDNAKKWSNIFLENTVHPMDEAMFWIEYVVRHEGAPFIKSFGVNQEWYQHYLLDVFGFFLITLIVAVGGIYFSIKWMRRHMNNILFLEHKKVE